MTTPLLTDYNHFTAVDSRHSRLKLIPFYHLRRFYHDIQDKGSLFREINFEVEDNKVKNVQFVGGCSGNTQGVARLIDGMDIDEAISPHRRHPVWLPPNFLPGSAGTGVEGV